jgi:hypothetical protein
MGREELVLLKQKGGMNDRLKFMSFIGTELNL